jgi:Fe-S-cluster containining protein
VYLTREDRRRLARFLGLSTRELIREYCVKSGEDYLFRDSKIQCLFLKDNRCSIYPARPSQCRTWPFWKDNMNPLAWRKKVIPLCPGAEGSDDGD